MTTQKSIRDIFFEEAEDLLDALSEGLLEIENGQRDSETINAVFRAVHSIKGGAGAFNLEDLVSFAHSFETVLEQIRSNKISPTPQLIGQLQKAGDILFDLVEEARDQTGRAIPEASKMVEEFEKLLEEVVGFSDDTEIDFVPQALFDPSQGLPENSQAEFEIYFEPLTSFYQTGQDPYAIFSCLKELGDLRVQIDTSKVDSFEKIDTEDAYLAWHLTLETSSAPPEVESVFEFVEGHCELRISQKADLPPEITPTLIENSIDEIHVNVPAAQNTATETNAKPEKSTKREARDSLRVDVDRIDRLINLVGELIVNQAMVAQRYSEIQEQLSPEAQSDLDDYRQLARDIQEAVMSLRTQPVRPLFQRMSRIVREAASATGKSVSLKMEGEWTEVDKKVTEKLADPLTHMVRNSVDHGIEDPDTRIGNGKTSTGFVTLSAKHKSGSVLIEIKDDGAGLNKEKIRKTALEKGIISEKDELTDPEVFELLFEPGFSTAKEVTNLSGRGVGMDVVRNAINELGGKISINSVENEGTTFAIQLPLTLAVLDGMVIEIGSQTLIIPMANVIEAIKPTSEQIMSVDTDQLVFSYRDSFVPVLNLSDCLNIPSSNLKNDDQVLLIIRANNQTIGFSVDSVNDQSQFVIKTISKNYASIPGISAATILGDGSVAMILDPDGVESWHSQRQLKSR